PIAGIAAAYMNFSIGFFLSGQVLAGILGSAVTFGYGADGKHGANYIQTLAASIGGMAGLGVLIQTMIWLGLAEPPTWQLIAYFLCVGIVGARIGVPAIVVGLIGLALTPWLREIGLLGPNDPWRKVGFLISLGAILGAAIVDIGLIVREALRRHGAAAARQSAPDWKRVN